MTIHNSYVYIPLNFRELLEKHQFYIYDNDLNVKSQIISYQYYNQTLYSIEILSEDLLDEFYSTQYMAQFSNLPFNYTYEELVNSVNFMLNHNCLLYVED